MAAYNGYLYAIGGRDGSSTHLKKCLYADIGSGGSLGSWKTCTNLPTVTSSHQHGAVAYKGGMYVFGGNGGKNLYYSVIASNGSLGSWKTIAVSFNTLAGVALQSGVNMYSIGGSDSKGPIADVYSATIASSGVPGTWTKFNPLPKAKSGHDGAVANGHLLIIGGTEPGMAGYSGTTSVYSVPF